MIPFPTTSIGNSSFVILYLNLHTHHPLSEDEATIPAFGLHPWYLTEDWKQDLSQLIAAHPEPFFLVGECGLDRLCDIPYDRQLEAFEAQIAWSERLGCPLLLHCVHAVDDVLRLKRGTHQPWIYHGFRGKPQQLEQLLTHGFYVSFGFRHNADSLRTCPADRLFLETDDTPQPIAPLYVTAAQLRNTTSAALCEQLWHNLTMLRSA